MKRCAVCGDTTKLNVRLAWRRDSDGKTVNVCCACAEAGAVNEKSIDNYTTEDTLYKEEKVVVEVKKKKSSDFYKATQSAFSNIGRRRGARRHE